jgi:hypothetical protein
MANVIDRAEGIVTPEIVDKIAASTGESPENTRKALRGALPTILAGFAHSASTPDGASSLLGTLRDGRYAGAAEKLLGGGDKREVIQGGQNLIGKIFGEGSAGASEALAAHSGVKSSSAAHILALAAPVVAGAIGPDVVAGGVAALVEVLPALRKAILEHPNTPPAVVHALGGDTGAKRDAAAAASKSDAAAVQEEEVRTRPGDKRLWAVGAGFGAAALVAWGVLALAPQISFRRSEVRIRLRQNSRRR